MPITIDGRQQLNHKESTNQLFQGEKSRPAVGSFLLVLPQKQCQNTQPHNFATGSIALVQ